MTDTSTSPSRTRRSRRSRIRQKQQSPASTTPRSDACIVHHSQSTMSLSTPTFRRVSTADGALLPVSTSPWEHRLNAMRRRKSLPVQWKMPSSYFELLQDDDDDDDEDVISNQRSSTWDQRKTALRRRSRSPLSPEGPSSPKSSSRRDSNNHIQCQSGSAPENCRWTSETDKKEKEMTPETSCRWQSSPLRRRSSSASPRAPLRGVRERGDRSAVNPADEVGSSPRLPKRKVSNNQDDPVRPVVPSPFSQTHMGCPSLETKGECGNTLKTLKMQVMPTRDTKSHHQQRNHAESA